MTNSTQGGPHGPKIIQWLLDTRPLWHVPKRASPREEVQELKTVASRALSLLSESEQASVLRYYHVKDAKMSLASHLLKHLVITKYCDVPWSKSIISRDERGKPCFVPGNASRHVTFDFNVSHQAGIVSLIASVGFKEKVDVGTDVVCANERLKPDYAHIEKQGFFDWVDIHGEVFAESELNFMKLSPVSVDGILDLHLTGFAKDTLSRCQRRNQQITLKTLDGKETTLQSNLVIDRKLRRFYAMWCLREAYVKMTGEALLAPWLKQLEITEVETPRAKDDFDDSISLEEGEIKADFPIFFKGEKVLDVKMSLVALGSNYMVAGSLRVPKEAASQSPMGKWELLNLDTDILAVAESNP